MTLEQFQKAFTLAEALPAPTSDDVKALPRWESFDRTLVTTGALASIIRQEATLPDGEWDYARLNYIFENGETKFDVVD